MPTSRPGGKQAVLRAPRAQKLPSHRDLSNLPSKALTTGCRQRVEERGGLAALGDTPHELARVTNQNGARRRTSVPAVYRLHPLARPRSTIRAGHRGSSPASQRRAPTPSCYNEGVRHLPSSQQRAIPPTSRVTIATLSCNPLFWSSARATRSGFLPLGALLATGTLTVLMAFGHVHDRGLGIMWLMWAQEPTVP